MMNAMKDMAEFYTDAQRMELRSYVNLAGEVVAKLWPMRTFISRNPLQGLEHLKFEEAVRRGEQLFGGRGYLPLDLYREEFLRGRIRPLDVDEVLRPLASDTHLQFGDRRLSHLDMLRTALIHGLHLRPFDELSSSGASRREQSQHDIDQMIRWMRTVVAQHVPEPVEDPSRFESDDWLRRETLATWCDRTLGTTITDQVNRQMVKWCAAFCDEGEAAWPMPSRKETFFRAWKAAARFDVGLAWIGIKRAAEKLCALADCPEDALLQSLAMLKVPKPVWPEYLSLHLAALPGWAGFIKWRAEQLAYPWQDVYRIDLVMYLAVRLFYERELVAVAFRTALACSGDVESVRAYARRFPHAVWFRMALLSGCLPREARREAARLRRRWRSADPRTWEDMGRRWLETYRRVCREELIAEQARLIVRLAEILGMRTELIPMTPPSDISTLLDWFRSFPPRLQALKWLEAYELTHQSQVLRQLNRPPICQGDMRTGSRNPVRPLGQWVFCIDVRSEVLRRHLERRGGYETFGFAGFFGLPMSYCSLDERYESPLCPVLLKPKHVIREVPRTYHGERAQQRKRRVRFAKFWRELLHDLKHNVITPYVMVEAVGWFYGLPLLGRSLWPHAYHRVERWLHSIMMPAVATTLTVDKLEKQEAEAMVAAEQRLEIAQWLRGRFRIPNSKLTVHALEGIRHQAMEDDQKPAMTPGALAKLLALPPSRERAVLEELRRECHVTPRAARARFDRITQTGFTLTEQAYYVETSLRLMGLTGPFARLVVLCGHSSSSQNNPYESALDCGACGGSSGLPNARAFAMIANRPQVRHVLAQRGLMIPADTHFLAGVHDTTTDEVRIVDLEDVPSTHREDLAQILQDLREACSASAAERWARLSGSSLPAHPRTGARAIERCSLHWAEVRPEWGLARNSVFIVGTRRLTRGVDLEGRAFLHSYDHILDRDGKLLEIIMTAPLIVAQWINLEYYFSTVDPSVYGSGSKVYHNVTGRIGVMTGNQSDLRMGLPVQSVMSGARPYHEPMRLTALIEAPLGRIMTILDRQLFLKTLFANGWLRLVALEPTDGRFYSYRPTVGWTVIPEEMIGEPVNAPVATALLHDETGRESYVPLQH
jgi:uncharacterized protein YbcC (UPF0753/DUF2309 family)